MPGGDLMKSLNPEKIKTAKAVSAGFGVYFLWGFTFLASRVAQNYVTPFVLLSYRFVIASLLLAVPVLLGFEKVRIKGRNIKNLLIIGLFEPCLYFIGEQYGVRLTNTAFSGVMIAIIPIVTMIFSFIFLKEKPSIGQWIFSAVSIAGVIIITLQEQSTGAVSVIGVLCLVLAVVTGALFTIVSRKLSTDFSVFERTLTTQIEGAVFFLLLALIEHRGNLMQMVTPLANMNFVLAILYLAVFGSVIGYTLFNYAVANAPTAKVVVLCNLTTVVSVVAGVVILKEPFTLISAAAILLVLIGIWGVQKT